MGNVVKVSSKQIWMDRNNFSIQWRFYEELLWRKWWRVFSWKWSSIPWKITEILEWLTFLPERKKIKRLEKPVTNLYHKTEDVIHIHI